MFHVKHLLQKLNLTQGYLRPNSIEANFDKLNIYLELLELWNSKIDLVSPAKKEILIERHIQDSFAAYLLISKEVGRINSCLDIGSGAGLPGIIFAILESQSDFYLLEPREKRQIFLKEAKSKLELDNLHLIKSRIEDYKSEAKFDLICSRALGIEDIFIQNAKRLISSKGSICQLLGPTWKGDAQKVIDYSLYKDGPKRKLVFHVKHRS